MNGNNMMMPGNNMTPTFQDQFSGPQTNWNNGGNQNGFNNAGNIGYQQPFSFGNNNNSMASLPGL
jgi:hypothetical protein